MPRPDPRPKDAAQAARQRHGEEFHGVVEHVLRLLLKGRGIHVVRMPKNNPQRSNPFLGVVKDQRIADDLLQRLRLPLKRPCDQQDAETYPDSDLVIVREVVEGVWRVLAVVNCKASLRDRHIQACFWGLAYRQHSGIRYFLVIPDGEREIGLKCGGNEMRTRLETCTDGVFIVRNFASVDDPALKEAIRVVTAQSLSDPAIVGHADQFDPKPLPVEPCMMVGPFSRLVGTIERLAAGPT